MIKRIGKAIRDADIWLNERFGGNEGETISSRWGRYIEDKTRPVRGWIARIVCRTVLLPLGVLMDNSWKHCRESINDKYRKEE